MSRIRSSFVFAVLLACAGTVAAQATPPHEAQPAPAAVTLVAQKEARALRILFKTVEKSVVSAATAMPADKYGFAPADGEFKDVRSFGQQVKHLAATNHILAAAALNEDPPSDAGDEQGPETVRTKAEILDYLTASFAHLSKAIDAIANANPAVKSSPISPLPATVATRLSLIVETIIHSFDHYGQMVVYLRMNGVVPPASRP
jgi:uncharacterized damage-inducible protein DinB